MVNYCCVYGCKRNSKLNKHLNYYSLPKERKRHEQWLKAAHREDLLSADKLKSSYRVCSRHFEQSSIGNRNLSPDAVPTLFLPGTYNEDNSSDEPPSHSGVVCNGCKNEINGFRYKCVSCQDYDLCMKCEMRETHTHHFMLRISKPLKFKKVDSLVRKWRELFLVQHVTISDCEDEKDHDSEEDRNSEDNSDDEPISKYAAKDTTYKKCLLTEDVKQKIRIEVARALKSQRNNTGFENNINSLNESNSNDYDIAIGGRKKGMHKSVRVSKRRKRENPSKDSKRENKKFKSVPSDNNVATNQPGDVLLLLDDDINKIEEMEQDIKTEFPSNEVCDSVMFPMSLDTRR